jgi:hypothetical protein
MFNKQWKGGDSKTRNETETKRNETSRNETKRNETQQKRNKIKRKRNQTYFFFSMNFRNLYSTQEAGKW